MHGYTPHFIIHLPALISDAHTEPDSGNFEYVFKKIKLFLFGQK